MSDPWIDLRRYLGRSLMTRKGEIVDTMFAAIESADPMLQDPEAASMLRASIAGNVREILSILGRGLSVEGTPNVPAAVDYAVMLAQRNVPSASLRRAYHIGSYDVLGHIFDEIQTMDEDTETRLKFLHHMAGWMHLYVDHITGAVLEAYESERRYWDDRDATAAAHQVTQLLQSASGDLSDFEPITGHRLDQQHVGALIWVEGASPAIDHLDIVSQMAHTLAPAVAGVGAPLITAIDRNTARVWFGRRGNASQVRLAEVRAVVSRTPGIRLALGRPSHGPEGFRRSMAQAEEIAVIPRIANPTRGHVVSHSDDATGLVARMVAEVEVARAWVSFVLGPLAHDSENAARQRETILTFLDTGGSFVETAERLVMHRNSIKYRIDRAEEVLGRPLEESRLDTQLALRVCELVGAPVLTPES